MTTSTQHSKVLSYLDQAHKEGLDCVTGGGIVEGLECYFIQPTIYWNVPEESALWSEEIFGPVLCTTTFATEREAIQIVNDSNYGLVGSIASRDWTIAKRISAQIEAGQIWINTPQIAYLDSAWGGFKSSAIGRELGPWGMVGYQGVKHILSPK